MKAEAKQVAEYHLRLDAFPGKVFIYRAFIEAELELPHHLDRAVHSNFFEPRHEDFQPRTMWSLSNASLSNAFTWAFKELDPIPQYKATAKRAGILQGVI